MSQVEENDVDRKYELRIVALPSKGLSKKAAAAKMQKDNPRAQVRGIRPEPINGEWLGYLEVPKESLSKFDDDNTVSFPNGSQRGPGESNAVEPLTPNDEPPAPDFENEDADEDASRDTDMRDILLDIKDLLMQVVGGEQMEEGQSGQEGVGGFRGGPWGSTDDSPVDEGPVIDDQKDVDPFGETDYNKPDDKLFGKASTIKKVFREREPGMTIKQARTEVLAEAKGNKELGLRNYTLVDFDVSSNGKYFEAYFSPTQRNKRR